MKLEQAARQALEALVVAEEFVDRHSEDWYISGQQDLKQIRESITALQEVLAEQDNPCKGVEQEPVAWILTEADGAMDFDCQPTIKPTQNDYDALREGETFTPLYAAPVRTKDLTDDEIYKLADDVDWAAGAYLGFARAVIAADREKNK